MDEQIALQIRVEGLVQGVGFRPFVYRLAKSCNLNGWVVNRNDGVFIRIEGKADALPPFIESLRYEAPVVAQIDEIIIDNDFPQGLQDFNILASEDLSDETSEICPDIAVCNECIEDMRIQPHRINYPFINCTNCGPRFSIIRDFPYDREKTTMNSFRMCGTCASEYEKILDRRFHAQPVACNDCGPKYTLHYNGRLEENLSSILTTIAGLVETGKIIAVKGMGGYHLMCDAQNEEAVLQLRNAKKREGKPFAVMFRNLSALQEFAEVSEPEESILTSWKRPVLLLQRKKELARGVCMGLNTIGCFLPYMPFQYLLFEKLHTSAIVLTSGNLAEEPIVIENTKALDGFKSIADGVLTYNRDIYNRTDDSVTRLISGKERVFRRSRGYAPSPVKLPYDIDGILATGAELSNCFCIGKGNQAILSQHIGDLKNYETYEFFEETIERHKKIYRFNPVLLAADLHPDYLSTRYAEKSGIETVRVQHHHAHVAACMAEYKLEGSVIGVCFDGTGYGTDGHSWGSEFLVADINDFQRYTHFDYLPLPGGDKVTKETWRTGISLLYKSFGRELLNLDIPFIRSLERNRIEPVIGALEKKINTPLSSGCGRLFDGIAAITDLCTQALFHAEAPMRLESVIAEGITGRYETEINTTIRFEDTIKQIVKDINHKIPVAVISARFHNSIIWSIFETVRKIRQETGITKVVLTGGSFQNKYLTEKSIAMLAKDHLEVYLAEKIPYNDGGIALGQLVIAARHREKVNDNHTPYVS
jgi:hydrogenase maturation protein HypF